MMGTWTSRACGASRLAVLAEGSVSVRMHALEIAGLGVLQGATEFLPISSSGHLRLAELLLGHVPESVALDVALHLGTLGAVLVFYRKDVLRLGRCLLPGGDPEDRVLVERIVLASIPTAILGLGMKKAGVERLGSLAVGLGLWVTATLDYSTERTGGGDRPITRGRALAIGIVQGIAVLPGVSRSGSTIAAAMALGIPALEAARFSFLCSIPAVAGAALLTARDLLEVADSGVDPAGIALGVALAFGVGIMALRFLVTQLGRGSFRIWGHYCLALGTVTVLVSLLRGVR